GGGDPRRGSGGARLPRLPRRGGAVDRPLLHAPRALPPGGPPARAAGGRRAGLAHRHAHQLPDRAHHGFRRVGVPAAVRRRHLRRQHGGGGDGARDGRDDDGDHHGGPNGVGLRRAARYDERIAGDRRARHHGHSAHGLPRAAPHARALHHDAAPLHLLGF